MVYHNRRGALGHAFKPTAELASVPASVGGINTLDSLMRMQNIDCLYTYNLMPAERGLLLRRGYREWANSAGTGDVRTILPYESQKEGNAQSRLWAVTNEGIYNVTDFGETSPSKDVTFSTNTGAAGFGVKCEFTNDDSDHYLFYADAVNGIHQYLEGTGWSVPSGWTYDIGAGSVPFPVADVAFVMVHKQRIWVILENSDDAWYLPVASIAGELLKFTFGAKMEHGGNLMGLWTWTVDGGAGIDDMLIALSRGGDVMVYQGQDPALTDFGSVGAWFVGAVPNSRRLVASYGSEMYLLSSFGITSLRDLLQGAVSNSLRDSPSAKINRDLRASILGGMGESEWSLNVHPADGFLQVVTPDPGSNPYHQFNQTLTTKAWGMWEDVPMVSSDTWDGDYYIGGAGGVVYQYQGVLDGTMLDGTVGEPVEYRVLTAFQPDVQHALFKRVGFVRTMVVGTEGESFNVRVVYDYKEKTLIPQSSAALSAGGAVWDTDLWDDAIWDYTVDGESYPKGTLGLGRAFAIAMRGRANARIEVIGWDVTFTTGGFL